MNDLQSTVQYIYRLILTRIMPSLIAVAAASKRCPDRGDPPRAHDTYHYDRARSVSDSVAKLRRIGGQKST
jgi:hypothetical protein